MRDQEKIVPIAELSSIYIFPVLKLYVSVERYPIGGGESSKQRSVTGPDFVK